MKNIKNVELKCNEQCQANTGSNTCMWKIDEDLIRLSHNPKYKMCEHIRKKILEMEKKK